MTRQPTIWTNTWIFRPQHFLHIRNANSAAKSEPPCQCFRQEVFSIQISFPLPRGGNRETPRDLNQMTEDRFRTSIKVTINVDPIKLNIPVLKRISQVIYLPVIFKRVRCILIELNLIANSSSTHFQFLGVDLSANQVLGGRLPNIAVPIRISVAPSSMATSKSCDMPMDNTGSAQPSFAASSSRSSHNRRK